MPSKQIKKLLIPGWDAKKSVNFGNALTTVYKMQQVHAQRAARGPKRRGGRRK